MKNWKLLAGGLGLALLVSVIGCELPGLAKSGGIHKAAKQGDVEKIKSLLAEDPSLVNSKDRLYGYTPLHTAAIAGQAAAAEFLLENGAEVNATDNKGHTPLYWAKKEAHEDLAELLSYYGGEE